MELVTVTVMVNDNDVADYYVAGMVMIGFLWNADSCDSFCGMLIAGILKEGMMAVVVSWYVDLMIMKSDGGVITDLLMVVILMRCL